MNNDQPIRWNKVAKVRKLLDQDGLLPEAADKFLIDELFESDRLNPFTNDLENANSELAADHRLYRMQANWSFVIACGLMIMGSTIALLGIAGFFLGWDVATNWVSIGVGAVIDLLTKIPFSFCGRCTKQLSDVSNQLAENRDKLQACRMAEQLPEPQRSFAIQRIIESLLPAKPAV